MYNKTAIINGYNPETLADINKHDVETCIANKVENSILIDAAFPQSVEIDFSDVYFFDADGDYLDEPTYEDLDENEYREIVTRHYISKAENDYIKYWAILRKVENGVAVYELEIDKYSPVKGV